MTFQEIKSILEEQFPHALAGEDLNSYPQALIVKAEAIHSICEFLHIQEGLYFDHLACLTGIDNGPEQNTMEVVYTLSSLPYGHSINLKVLLDRTHPEVDTVSDIWRTANWNEREAYDLLGIMFKNHPDLRRILMPTDWVGHPLRKDYQEQATYHGMVVKYDRDDKVESFELKE